MFQLFLVINWIKPFISLCLYYSFRFTLISSRTKCLQGSTSNHYGTSTNKSSQEEKRVVHLKYFQNVSIIPEVNTNYWLILFSFLFD